MPIIGLTDRGLAFPEIGQLRKGAPKNEQGYVGKDLNYFRVTFDEAETAAAATFKRVYGEQPKEVNIVLPFDDIDRVWEAWLECYTAGRMVARADGQRYIYRVNPQTGEMVVKNGEPFTPYKDGEVVAEIITGNKKEQLKCKPTGRLKVVIPELQRLAYVTVLTTSINDIGNISAQLEAIKKINGGRIVGIPLVLRRRPKKISTPDKDGKRARRLKYMLSIEADPEWVKAKLLEVKSLALPGNGLALLPEPQPHEDPAPEHQDDYDPDEEDDDIPGNPVMEGEFEEPALDYPPDFQPKLSYENAKAVKNAQGTLYDTLPSKILKDFKGKIAKAGASEDNLFKIDAIDSILFHRQQQSIDQATA